MNTGNKIAAFAVVAEINNDNTTLITKKLKITELAL